MNITLRRMSLNEYSLGNRKARVRRIAENPDWASWQNATELMNCAFELYYRAAQNISRTRNTQLQTRMTDLLEDCATEGWGGGVSDLDEAFQHLVKYDGEWYDRNPKAYTPTRYSFYFPDHGSFFPAACTSAESCVNFLKAMEDVASGVLANGQELQQQMERLEHALSANRWDTVSDICLGINVGTGASEVLSEISLLSGLRVLEPFRDSRITTPVTTLSEAGDAITSGLRNYEALRARGVDARSAQGIGILSTVAALVPVFGWYFEKALEYCPALVDVVQGWARRRERILAEADLERLATSRGAGPGRP